MGQHRQSSLVLKRKICAGCERPAKVCLCQWLKCIENFHPVTVLRHKSEAGHALNTVKLLEKSLKHISVYDGEDFPESSVPIPKNSYLVYPSDDAKSLNTLDLSKKTNFIFLDGSWKKTRKLIHLNPWLEKLPKIQLPFQQSRYFLRKQKENGFSTLEAAYSVLSDAESKPQKYQNLIQILDQLMAIQSTYIEPEVLKKHFGERLARISSGKSDSKAESLSDHSSLGGIPLHPRT